MEGISCLPASFAFVGRLRPVMDRCQRYRVSPWQIGIEVAESPTPMACAMTPGTMDALQLVEHPRGYLGVYHFGGRGLSANLARSND